MSELLIRAARPADYDPIAAVVDGWWGRPILDSLPRLFLDHFWSTSLIAEEASGERVELRGFLIGFMSPSEPAEAYIHFVGIAPEQRGRGLGAELYDRFFAMAKAAGRSHVCAVTSPVNTASIAFHRATGFTATDAVAGYNGPGHDLVLFHREL